jgi:hypothetical protein
MMRPSLAILLFLISSVPAVAAGPHRQHFEIGSERSVGHWTGTDIHVLSEEVFRTVTLLRDDEGSDFVVTSTIDFKPQQSLYEIRNLNRKSFLRLITSSLS